ncbi:MAG TPA: hypothetical protein VGD84_20510 [Pseudonocardiaceae bacterium]
MLLWINGPFGGGKTQTAYEMCARLPGSVVCDPEHVGFGLHRMMPPSLRGDFQDLPAWRQGVYEVLDLALTRHDGTVIAPTMPRQQRARCHDAVPALFTGQQPRQGGQGRTIRPRRTWPAGPTAQNRNLVAEHQDLDILGGREPSE